MTVKPKKRSKKKMKTDVTEITINGQAYVLKGSASPPETNSGYAIVRCQGAGVFMAKIVSRSGTEAVLKDSHRLWYWSGAASLSQLAVEGTKKPNECKFPVAMPNQEVTGVLEVIPMTEAAAASLKSVPVWKQ
jgi:hypothetical protein